MPDGVKLIFLKVRKIFCDRCVARRGKTYHFHNFEFLSSGSCGARRGETYHFYNCVFLLLSRFSNGFPKRMKTDQFVSHRSPSPPEGTRDRSKGWGAAGGSGSHSCTFACLAWRWCCFCDRHWPRWDQTDHMKNKKNHIFCFCRQARGQTV